MTVRIDWDEDALEELLNSWDGPVGQLIDELSARAAIVAAEAVHVRPGTASSRTTGRTSNARPPGFTKSRTRPHRGRGARTGKIYGGVNAPADPAIFLEDPARQMGRPYPFLTTGLLSLEGTL